MSPNLGLQHFKKRDAKGKGKGKLPPNSIGTIEPTCSIHFHESDLLLPWPFTSVNVSGSVYVPAHRCHPGKARPSYGQSHAKVRRIHHFLVETSFGQAEPGDQGESTRIHATVDHLSASRVPFSLDSACRVSIFFRFELTRSSANLPFLT